VFRQIMFMGLRGCMQGIKRLVMSFVRAPVELLCYLMILIFNLLPRIELVDRGRFIILRAIGMKGKGRFTILSPVEISPYCAQTRIRIDGPSFINAGFRMAVPSGGSIIIEEGVMIGPRVQLECMNHARIEENGKAIPSKSGVIRVGKKAWIGAGVIVLADSVIGEGAIVAAGSVVRGDVEPHTLVAGVPAKFKKRLKKPE